MNIRRRMTLNRWKRRIAELAPLVLGIAIGALAFAVFDQTYGEETPSLPESVQTVSAPASPFRNCDEARAARVAPMHRGQPGYSPRLDADLDGVACEPYPR